VSAQFVFLAAIVFCTVCIANFVSSSFELNLFRRPRLVVDREDINLGSVAAQQSIPVVIRIRNGGGGALEINSVNGSCDSCISVLSWPTNSLGADEYGEIELTVKTGASAGASRKRVIIESNDWTGKPYMLMVTWTTEL